MALSGTSSTNVAYTSLSAEDIEYNMRHKKRGQAIIFSHKKFDKLPKRQGATKDLEGLTSALERLEFDVVQYKDSTVNEIYEHINNAAKTDHTDSDCLLIAILSHGKNDGYIEARDGSYNLDYIFDRFTADRCPSLAGKPKIFFIQACRGERLDPGKTYILNKDSISPHTSKSYRLPVYADFIMSYSTIPNFASWRSPVNGSWFIQALVQVLNEHGQNFDICFILTIVNRRLAIDFESFSKDKTMDYKKQISCFTSMLTRILRFEKKLAQ